MAIWSRGAPRDVASPEDVGGVGAGAGAYLIR
jgi:hypothetical protein